MKANYTLQLTLSPSVTLFCLFLGINWYPAIVIGFVSFYVSLLVDDLVDKIYRKMNDD